MVGRNNGQDPVKPSFVENYLLLLYDSLTRIDSREPCSICFLFGNHNDIMIKAVFFDIDGTLVSFKTHSIPLSTVNAIHRLKILGIKTFIATGRPFAEIPDLQGIEFDGYITLNGACCLTADHTIIHKSAIPREDVDAAIRYLETKKKFPCSFMCNSGIFVNYVDERVKEVARMVNLPTPRVRSLHGLAREDVYQINIYVDEQQEKELMEEVFTHCNATRWTNLFADVNVLGISKQTGIDNIIGYFGIDLSETLSFGDGGNDIPMLIHTAIGIAMGNAKEEIKQVADYITDHIDEDGIAKALDRFVFKTSE